MARLSSTFFTTLLASFAIAPLGMACVDSPLLNHRNMNELFHQTEGCAYTFEKSELCASLEWTKAPSESEKGAFILRFWNPTTGSAAGPYVDPGKTVFVKLWMPGMGHGSSPVTVRPATDDQGQVIPGTFIASEVYFVMGGAWEIWVQLRQGKDVIDQAKTDISIDQ